MTEQSDTEVFPPVFEGPEKVLEIWFVNPEEYEDDSDPNAKPRGENGRYLLDVCQQDWQDMLDLVHCQILSVIENDHARAYLLSESSMFVYQFQIVIKTCGTTTLLKCLSKLLEIAEKVGLVKVDNVFYNRQNFFFPDRQLEPHQGFKSECRILDSYFNNGGAYIVGRVNENHYNFYNAECRMNRDDPLMLEKDTTLEILMTGLCPERMRAFYYDETKSNQQIREETGIANFFPGSLIDDYMFQPFGYSLNGLVNDGYFTIHITPQPNCSFASFETNVYMEDYTELILKVLNAFQPERFIMAHLANSLVSDQIKTSDKPHGYDLQQICQEKNLRCVDDIFCHFEHYDLYFNQLQRATKQTPRPQRRRHDEHGTILKPSSPFQKGKTGADLTIPAFSLLGDDVDDSDDDVVVVPTAN